MKPFQFSLQRVLEMREEALKAAEQKLELSRAVHEQLKSLLMKERDCYFEEREMMNAEIRSGKFENTKIYERSLASRKSKMMQLLEAAKVAEEDVRFAEHLYSQEKRNVKSVENIKDKQLKKYKEDSDKQERKALDEISLTRYWRREHMEK
jgi:flagellar export protein FliJ